MCTDTWDGNPQDICILCFSVIAPASFKNVDFKWKNDIYLRTPGIPIVLVGTKLDLRDDPVEVAKLKKRVRGRTEIQTFGHLTCLVT